LLKYPQVKISDVDPLRSCQIKAKKVVKAYPTLVFLEDQVLLLQSMHRRDWVNVVGGQVPSSLQQDEAEKFVYSCGSTSQSCGQARSNLKLATLETKSTMPELKLNYPKLTKSTTKEVQGRKAQQGNSNKHKDDKATTHYQPQTTYSPDSDAYRTLLDDLAAVIAPIQALHLQAVEALKPNVREIIDSNSRDARLIEHTLDHLLDHACIPQGLVIFKSLCRHYWEINPHVTANYINAYREMWDNDDHETNQAEG
jgi:hypothetical protein